MKNFSLGLSALIILVLLLTSGCNRSEVMFQFADELAASKADDYLDLTSEQKSALKKDIQKDINAAKKEVFPQIAKKLREIEPQVDKGPITAEFLSSQTENFREYLKKTTVYFKDTAVKTAMSLTPAQIDHFAEEVREKIEEKEDLEEARKDVEKRYRRSLEFWMGGISKEQKDKITDFLVANPYPTELENKSKEHVLTQFIAASKKPEQLKKFVEGFVADYEQPRLPAYTQALAAHKKAFQKFLAENFWPTVNDTQKSTLKKNLIARSEELDRLAVRD